MAKKRWNVIDILIILVVLALLALAVYKIGGGNKKETAELADAVDQTTYTAFIGEVRMPTVNALHEGDKMFDDKTGIYIGTIKSVSHQPVMKNVLQLDGSAKETEYLGYYNVRLTIEGPVMEKDEGYFVDGVVELKANSEMPIVTKYAQPVIKITSIGT